MKHFKRQFLALMLVLSTVLSSSHAVSYFNTQKSAKAATQSKKTKEFSYISPLKKGFRDNILPDLGSGERDLVERVDLGLVFPDDSYIELYSDGTLLMWIGYSFNYKCTVRKDKLYVNFPWSKFSKKAKKLILYSNDFDLNMKDWFRNFTLKSVSFRSNVAFDGKVSVTNLDHAFYGCDINEVNFDGLDVSKCTNFDSAFRANNLFSIDGTSNWNMRSAVKIDNLFSDNGMIDVTLNWDLPKCTSANEVFRGCRFLDSISIADLKFGSNCSVKDFLKDCSQLVHTDLEDMDVSKFTDMSGFIRCCSTLRCLNTSKWNMQNVTKMDYFAQGDINLDSLNLDGLKTAKNLESAIFMFADCSYLKDVSLNNVINNSIKTLQNAFCNCVRLKSVDFSNCTFNALERCDSLFQGCIGLKSVNLSDFKAVNCDKIDSLFDSCKGLKSLDLSATVFNWKSLNIYKIFNNCISLRDLNLTNWELSNSSGIEAFNNTLALRTIKCPSSVSDSIALETVNKKYTYRSSNNKDTSDNLVANDTLTRISLGNKPIKGDTDVDNPYPEEEEAKDKIVPTNYTLNVSSVDDYDLSNTVWKDYNNVTVEDCNGTKFVVTNDGVVLGILDTENNKAFIPKKTSEGVVITKIGDGISSIATGSSITNLYVEADTVFSTNSLSDMSSLKEVRVKTTGDIAFEEKVFNDILSENSSLIIENSRSVVFDIYLQKGVNLSTVKIKSSSIELGYAALNGVETIVFENDDVTDIIQNSNMKPNGSVECKLKNLYFIGGGYFNFNVDLSYARFPYDSDETINFALGYGTTLYWGSSSIIYDACNFRGSDNSKLITDRTSGVNVAIKDWNLYDLEIGHHICVYDVVGQKTQSLITRNDLIVTDTTDQYYWVSYALNVLKVYGSLNYLANNQKGGLGNRNGSYNKPNTTYVNKLVAFDDGTLPAIGNDSFGGFLYDSWYIGEIVNESGDKLDEWKFRDTEPYSQDYFNGYFRNFHMPKGCVKMYKSRFQQVYAKNFDFDFSKIEEVPYSLFMGCKFSTGYELCFDKRVDWSGGYMYFSTYKETGMNNEFKEVYGLDTLRFKDGIKSIKSSEFSMQGIANVVFDPTETLWSFDHEYFHFSQRDDTGEGVNLDIGEGCEGFKYKGYDDIEKYDGIFDGNYNEVKLPASFNLIIPNAGSKPLFASNVKTLTIADGNPVGFNNLYDADDAEESAPECFGNIENLVYSNTAKNFSNSDLKNWQSSGCLKSIEVRGVDTALVNKAGYDMIPTTSSAITVTTRKSLKGAPAVVSTDNSESYFYDLINKKWNESSGDSSLLVKAHDNSRFKNTLNEATENGLIKPYDYESLCDYHEVKRVEPTYDKEGYVIYKCDVCNAAKKEILPKLQAEKVTFLSVKPDSSMDSEAEGRIPKGDSIAESDTINVENDTVSIVGFSKINNAKSFAVFSKLGYDFEGYYADPNLTNEYDFEEPVNENTTIYAKVTPTDYSINYNKNGGEFTGEVKNKYNYGDSFDLPTNIEKKGNTFNGWYQDETNSKVDKIEPEDYGDLNVTAGWDLIDYNIVYDLNGGKFNTTVPNSYTVEDDLVIPNPVRNGYTFKGWEGTDLSIPTKDLVISRGSTGDKSYKAVWIENTSTRPDTPTDPIATPTVEPSASPSSTPTASPSPTPTAKPSSSPSPTQTAKPTSSPSPAPTAKPTSSPSPAPEPSLIPTSSPTIRPTVVPTSSPSIKPSARPSIKPTLKPTEKPTAKPTLRPTNKPTIVPSSRPEVSPTPVRTHNPYVTSTPKPKSDNNPKTGDEIDFKGLKIGVVLLLLTSLECLYLLRKKKEENIEEKKED